MTVPTLYVGNRNYSSWSLRPWLVLTWAKLPFTTVDVELDAPGYGHGQIADVLAVSPSGRVPALHVGDLVIWDSLAIAEWAAERAPDLWPRDSDARAVARAVTCEMHAGFGAVRHALPMNIRRRTTARDLPDEALAELARLDALWSSTRTRWAGAGPYLFGARSIADAFFTPVATRLRTYGVAQSPAATAYRDTLLADSGFRAWEDGVLATPATRMTQSNVDEIYADVTSP